MPRPRHIPRPFWLLFPLAALLFSLLRRGPSQAQPAPAPADAHARHRGHRDAGATPAPSDASAAPAPEGDGAAAPTSDAALEAGATAAQTATEPATTVEGPQVVYVGVFVHHVPELDLRTNTYLLDFYLWFRWAGSIDPTRTYEFTNAVESWDQLRTPVYTGDDGAARPELLSDGQRYQVYHVQGRFLHPFPLQDYPFDRQDITVEFEDSQNVEGTLVYRIDTSASGYHGRVSLPGWRLLGAAARVDSEHYRTNFGDPRFPASGDNYSHFTYALHLERPVGGYLAKVLVPMGIVLLISFIVFFMHPRYFEARVTIALTNLISAVALQLSSAADLPNVGYLVLLDRIYHLCYFMIFLCLAESVVVARLHDDGRESAARRLDRACLLVCPLLVALGLWYLLARR